MINTEKVCKHNFIFNGLKMIAIQEDLSLTAKEVMEKLAKSSVNLILFFDLVIIVYKLNLINILCLKILHYLFIFRN